MWAPTVQGIRGRQHTGREPNMDEATEEAMTSALKPLMVAGFAAILATAANAQEVATAIRDALGESKTPMQAPAAASPPPAVDLDTAQIDQIIGVKGQANGGVYQLAVPRRDLVTENGMQLTPPGPLGVNTAIGFQPTGGGKAAITGDFVLIGTEVNPFIKEVKAAVFEYTAKHNNMRTE